MTSKKVLGGWSKTNDRLFAEWSLVWVGESATRRDAQRRVLALPRRITSL